MLEDAPHCGNERVEQDKGHWESWYRDRQVQQGLGWSRCASLRSEGLQDLVEGRKGPEQMSG